MTASIQGTRPEFSRLAVGWRGDSFDGLMSRISMIGDWVQQNGGPRALQWGERATVSKMMARALRAGFAGAVPRTRGTGA